MSADQPLLRVEDLRTRYFTEEGQVNAVDGVSFSVDDGEVYGLVGESGSGKTVTGLSLLDLVETPGRVTGGAVYYRDAELAASVRDGEVGTVAADPDRTDAGAADEDRPAVDGDLVDLRQLPERVRRSLRGPALGMVFQDPMSSMNPSLTVGEQIAEAVEAQRRASERPRSTRSRTQGYGLGRLLLDAALPGRGYTGEESHDRAIELLDRVGIPDAAERAAQYPHEFSGGMLQRAMVAQALAGEPDLLVADEPTTGLDVTIQAQVLDLLAELQREADLSVVLITHDLGVIAHTADRVGVMYAGQVVERGDLSDVFDDPVHPYTQGLLGSVPDVDDPSRRLSPIEGNVPELVDAEMPDGCYFADRCPKAMRRCLEPVPERAVVRDGAAPGSDGESADGDGTGARATETPGTDPGHRARCVLADGEYDPSAAVDAADLDWGWSGGRETADADAGGGADGRPRANGGDRE